MKDEALCFVFFCIPENHALDAWFYIGEADGADKKLLLL